MRATTMAALAALLAAGTLATNPDGAGGGETPSAGERPEVFARYNSRVLPAKYRKLLELSEPLGPPQPGDWLDQHEEPGQNFRQYVTGRPVRPDDRRRTICVQPLGEFDRTERQIIEQAAEFLGIYFELPVKVLDDLSLDVIPDEARRVHPQWGDHQILSGYVLQKVLKPRLPRDACTYIAFTTSDLWPGEGWNFVFGQASLSERVGVWSIHRNGDPSAGADAYRLCLLRTLKIATHETGHMFSMQHCVYFECNMCGCNHREESDRRPLALCPDCLAKLCYATGADPIQRYEKLIDFCRRRDLPEQRVDYEKRLAALRD